MTAAVKPDGNLVVAVLYVSTSPYFDVSKITIVALLPFLILLTSILPLTMFHAHQCIPPLLQRILYRSMCMLTILATRHWILLVVCEEEGFHSLLMNNHGFSKCPVRFISPLPSEICLDVTSISIWLSIPVVGSYSPS